jgi:poly-gamma-glutamate synthesis protein (capsule biosynthesis protein)
VKGDKYNMENSLIELIKSELNANIVFGNLESPISDRGVNVGSLYSFRADPNAVLSLKNAGFNIVSFANNHVWDYGKDSFLDTLNNLGIQGINFVGAGENFEESHTPKIIDIDGTKIAFLAYTDLAPAFLLKASSSPSVANITEDQIISDISKIKERGLQI